MHAIVLKKRKLKRRENFIKHTWNVTMSLSLLYIQSKVYGNKLTDKDLVTNWNLTN
jgi:hypothetical protein